MKARILGWILIILATAAFLFSLHNLEQSRRAEGKRTLEEAVRNAAVACYAAEGAYPPDTAYLQQHYGLHYDQEHYIIHYELVASNLMPEITVLEK